MVPVPQDRLGIDLMSPGIFDLIKIGQNMIDPDVIRTRSLLIWSQTRYRCATESCYTFHSNLTRDSNN
jgi:hypothetical protein